MRIFKPRRRLKNTTIRWNFCQRNVTVFFHDFDSNLRPMANKQFERMKLTIFGKLHKFVEQANVPPINQ